MDYLSDDWFLENNIDSEYQRYRLLAYLKGVHEQFKQSMIYPYLDEIKNHHRNLLEFVNKKSDLEESFPTKVEYSFGEGYIEIHSEPVHVEIDEIKEIDDTVNYSISEIEREIEFGEQVLSYVDDTTTIEPLTKFTLTPNIGYWLIKTDSHWDVWHYKISKVLVAENLAHVEAIKVTEESLSSDVSFIRKSTSENSDWWVVESRENPPIENTLIPILKCRVQSYALDT